MMCLDQEFLTEPNWPILSLYLASGLYVIIAFGCILYTHMLNSFELPQVLVV